MVSLSIIVTGGPKWVKIEDVAGPKVLFDDIVDNETITVPIVRRRSAAGHVVALAGLRRDAPVLRFHDDNFDQDCSLVLDDEILPREDDEPPPACRRQWDKIGRPSGKHEDDGKPRPGTGGSRSQP
jgi:hypothetical protein